MAKGNTLRLLADLHAHSAHSAIGEFVPYPPAGLVEAAAHRGLGGIALTGHDTFAGVEEALSSGADTRIVVTPGVEITCGHVSAKYGVRTPHIVGLLPCFEALRLESLKLRPPSLRKPRYVAEWIHAHGGVAVVAHPASGGNFISLSHHEIKKLAPWIDGVETRTRLRPEQDEVLDALVKRLGLAAIGSSDAHDLDHIGVVVTDVFGLPDSFNSDDILEAVRQRRTEARVLRVATEAHMKEGSSASYFRRRRTSKSERAT